jgi:hypothetical protein
LRVTAILCTTIISPLIRKLPQKSQWPRMVLLAISFSCNVGGMATPIASPQNVIAVVSVQKASHGASSVSFAGWCAFAVPFSLVLTFIAWGWLRVNFKTALPDGIKHDFGDTSSEPDTDDTPIAPPTEGAHKPPFRRLGTDPVRSSFGMMPDTDVFMRHSQDLVPPHVWHGMSPGGSVSRMRSRSDVGSPSHFRKPTSMRRVSFQLVPRESIPAPKQKEEGLGRAEWIVLITVIGTAVLWVGFSLVEPLLGSLGIVAVRWIVGGCFFLSVEIIMRKPAADSLGGVLRSWLSESERF